MKTRVLCAVLAVAGCSGAVCAGELIVALTSQGTLVTVDSSNPGMPVSISPAITGLLPGETIVDIDRYPVDRRLYGLGTSGRLYRLNRMTGAAMPDVVPQASIGSPQDMDFNPVADRLRIFSSWDENYRLTPSMNTGGPTGVNAGLVSVDGTLTYAGGTPNPSLVAAAYTNNVDGALTTTLFSIDSELDALVVHSGAPQFSMLAPVAGLTLGGSTLDVGKRVGLDVSPSGEAFMSHRNTLYTLNLTNGQLFQLGAIPSGMAVETIAVVPAPGAMALGMLALAINRRRR